MISAPLLVWFYWERKISGLSILKVDYPNNLKESNHNIVFIFISTIKLFYISDSFEKSIKIKHLFYSEFYYFL